MGKSDPTSIHRLAEKLQRMTWTLERKPLPNDYGLSVGDPDRLERQKEQISALIIVLCGTLVLVSLWVDSGLLFLLTLAIGGMWIIASIHIPKYKSAKEFREAEAAHERWLVSKAREAQRAKEEFWESLTGLEFERELANLYQGLDYTAQVTKAAGDRGVDIILQRDGKKIIVQCKAHAKPVGPHIVRDLYGALHDFNADSAVLASLGGFTSGVYEYVMGKPIELIQLADIIEMQKKAFGDPDANAEWADVKLPKKYTSWQQIMQESLDKQAEQARERLRAKGFLDEKGHLRTDGDDIP